MPGKTDGRQENHRIGSLPFAITDGVAFVGKSSAFLVEPRSVRNQDFDLLPLCLRASGINNTAPAGRHRPRWLLVAALIYSVARRREGER
jgi:hypothetical protein